MAAKPKVRFNGRVDQVLEGVPYRLKYRADGSAVEHTICCQCGLVHLVEYRPNQDGISIKVWRDDEQTKKLRKK